MWQFVLILVIVIAALIGFRFAKVGRKPEKEIPTYVCPDCGERHCNCYLEKKNGG